MTDEIDIYSLMMEVYTELKPEMEAARHSRPIPARPTLSKVLTHFGPMPPEALFLGVAMDELPVLLNLHDPVPGPLLIISDPGAGKTALLQSLAHAIEKMHQPEEVRFGAVTNHPEEWSEFDDCQNQIGTFSISDPSSQHFINSLAEWAHGNSAGTQSLILLIDDLEAISNMDAETVQNLRWLFLRGPSKRIWPIITLSTQYLEAMGAWLGIFRTRILGRIQNTYQIQMLGAQQAGLNLYKTSFEFALREGNHWLKFWIPSSE